MELISSLLIKLSNCRIKRESIAWTTKHLSYDDDPKGWLRMKGAGGINLY